MLEKLKLAFWDKMQDEIKEKDYTSLLSVINEITERICI